MVGATLTLAKEELTTHRGACDRGQLLERLVSTTSASFRWTNSGKHSTSLTSDGKVYATISWPKRWGSLATAESADGNWTLKRAGFLRPRVTVRKSGSETDLVVVRMDWSGGGLVTFNDAASFRFVRVGFWRPEWNLLDMAGRKILVLRPSIGMRRSGAAVEIESGAVRSSWRTLLLAIIMWYVCVLVSQYDYDGGASVAAVMAATGI